LGILVVSRNDPSIGKQTDGVESLQGTATSMDTFYVRNEDSEIAVSEALFAWRGGEIVLIGEQSDDRWYLARGWRSADRLTDVRRWSFADAQRFVAQVRRLVWEAAPDPVRADRAAAAAAGWVMARTGQRPGTG
jgi:hypothetical protein